VDQPSPAALTVEQQFNLAAFKKDVEKMSREQAQQFLARLYEQMLLRENMFKYMIKRKEFAEIEAVLNPPQK
jgi:Phycobilisome degradation protein nblA